MTVKKLIEILQTIQSESESDITITCGYGYVGMYYDSVARSIDIRGNLNRDYFLTDSGTDMMWRSEDGKSENV